METHPVNTLTITTEISNLKSMINCLEQEMKRERESNTQMEQQLTLFCKINLRLKSKWENVLERKLKMGENLLNMKRQLDESYKSLVTYKDEGKEIALFPPKIKRDLALLTELEKVIEICEKQQKETIERIQVISREEKQLEKELESAKNQYLDERKLYEKSLPDSERVIANWNSLQEALKSLEGAADQLSAVICKTLEKSQSEMNALTKCSL